MKCNIKGCEAKAIHLVNYVKPKSSRTIYCGRCDEHLQDRIDSIKRANFKGSYGTICMPCTGTGKVPRFNHVQGGICFRCKGTGIMGIAYQIKREEVTT